MVKLVSLSDWFNNFWTSCCHEWDQPTLEDIDTLHCWIAARRYEHPLEDEFALEVKDADGEYCLLVPDSKDQVIVKRDKGDDFTIYPIED